MLAILLLAAGRSSRMDGRDKLLEEIDGEALLTVMTKRAVATGCPVYVVLHPDRSSRQLALQDIEINEVIAQDADAGMAHSLAAGIKALEPEISAAMILPADMPELTTHDLKTLHDQWVTDQTAIVQATSQDGTPGHPVIFPRDLFPDLAALTGDTGARAVLAANTDRLLRVALKGTRARTDLDTPEDWQRWRETHDTTN